MMFSPLFDTPWKICNELLRLLVFPYNRLSFALAGIAWGKGWRLQGSPIIQKHRKSLMVLGDYLNLRSTVRSNPLGPEHPVILCTWQAGSLLEIGAHFGMTGGTICAAERITIGDRVIVGANSTIIDTDFHPLDSQTRHLFPQNAKTKPVLIDDDVFIGMNCLILKGVHLGKGCVIGAGSVVIHDVPQGFIAAGNPARVLKEIYTQP
jgi:acetyltransferase-like isoleucine patch superfamily enzyme